MKKVGLLLCVCMALSVTANADFITITFRDGFTNALSGGVVYAGTEDTAIRSAGPGIAYNEAVSSIVGFAGTSTDKMLLRFDLTSLTSGLAPGEGIQINSATLFYSKTATTLAAARTLSIHQITAANAGWIEGVSTWNAMVPSVSSWAGSAGLSTADVDYNSSVVATETVTGPAATFNTALSVAMVQRWVDNPDNNAGVLFTLDAPQGEFIRIYTSEYIAGDPPGPSWHRPALTIDYEVIEKGEQIVFQDGFTNALSGGVAYAGTEDIGIRSAAPGQAYDGTTQIVGFLSDGGDKMLLRFDLTALTSGLTEAESVRINSATLSYAKINEATLTAARTLSIHQIASANAGWIEGTSTWNAMVPGVSNWAGSAGLSTADVDYDSSVVATETVTPTIQRYDTALSVAMVQGWVDSPADNAGLLFTLDAPQGEYIRIYTSEYAPGDNPSTLRPALTLDYSVIPEPATLGIFLLFSVGLLLLRRSEKN